MKKLITVSLLPLLLVFAGCTDERPDILEALVFTEGEFELDRDTDSDPTELVDSVCCNDYLPYPLQFGNTIQAEIKPAGDIDYFSITLTGQALGQLFLWSDNELVMLRIFDTSYMELGIVVDTLASLLTPTIMATSLVNWTTLAGQEQSFVILVQGLETASVGSYNLAWVPLVTANKNTLRIVTPDADEQWVRGLPARIKWYQTENKQVGIYLLNGQGMDIEIGTEQPWFGNDYSQTWFIPPDLAVGSDYRILIYLLSNPQFAAISDEFTLR